MDRTIRVKGNGKLLVKPDTIRLNMTIEGVQDEYDLTVGQSAAMTEELKELFVKQNFEPEELKTVSFNISAEYEEYQAKDKSWKSRFTGYKFRHCIKVEFPADNKRLSAILYALAHIAVCPKFRIEHTVAEPEKCKNELLAKAIKDSKMKADVLTKAAGVSLGNVVSIEYSQSDIDFVSYPTNEWILAQPDVNDFLKEDAAYEIDINPEDISVTEEVTVVWEIQ